MSNTWVSVPPENHNRLVHLVDARSIDRTSGNVGIIIVNDKHEGFAKSLLSLLNTMGLVNGITSEVVVLYHRNSKLTHEKFRELMKWNGCGVRNLRLLYDVSGLFDDDAIVKSGEIIEVRDENTVNSKHAGNYAPELHLMSPDELIEKRFQDDIRDAVRHGACFTLFDNVLRDFTEYRFDANYLCDAVSGISCGRVSLPITQNDVEDYFYNPDNTVNWGLDSTWALKLVQSKAVRPHETDVVLIDAISKIDGMMKLWKRALEFANMPIAIAPHKDMDKIDVDMLSKLAEMVSMDSYLDAYLAGVPIEDIFA